MVGFLTYGNKKFYELDGQMRKLIPPLYKAMKDLTPFVDADAAAFSEYMVSTSPCVLQSSPDVENSYLLCPLIV